MSCHPLQKCKQDKMSVFFCSFAERTATDASNYATERRTAASVRTQGRTPKGQTTNWARDDFQQRFGQAGPPKQTLLRCQHKLSATGNIILAPNCSELAELYLHPLHSFTVCTRTSPPPPQTPPPFILLSMPYSGGNMDSLRAQFTVLSKAYRNVPLESTGGRRFETPQFVRQVAQDLPVPLYPFIVLSNVSLYAARIVSSFTSQRTRKNIEAVDPELVQQGAQSYTRSTIIHA